MAGGGGSGARGGADPRVADFITTPCRRRAMSSSEMATTEQAKNMRSGVNIEAELARKGEPRTVNTKAGNQINVCDSYLKDDAGEIKLTLWGDDIEKVKQGDRVKITNGYISEFRGEIALTKGKFGKMDVTPGS